MVKSLILDMVKDAKTEIQLEREQLNLQQRDSHERYDKLSKRAVFFFLRSGFR